MEDLDCIVPTYGNRPQPAAPIWGRPPPYPRAWASMLDPEAIRGLGEAQRYVDMSTLNNRYRYAHLAGMGGTGAGSLGGSSIGGDSLGFDAGGLAWKGSAHPGVMELQSDINAILKRLGYYNIGVDGVIGAGTCGAIALLGSLGEKVTDTEWATLDPAMVDAVVAVCQGHPATTPTKSGTAAPPPPSSKTTATTTATKPASSSGMDTASWLLVGVAVAGGFYLLTRKKK